MTDDKNKYILSINGMSKSFGRNKVLKHISMNVKPGTIMGLMGENGAGKSTMMKCLFGTYQKDEGTIVLDGKEVNFSGPKDALENGVAMVHQELNQCLERSVVDNMFLGRYPKNSVGVIDEGRMKKETSDLFRKLGITVDLTQPMKKMSVSQRQMCEIAKAISYHSKVIVLDEPTSSLTAPEVEKLFKMMRQLKAQGIALIYISHKMDEIFEICDEISVLRDGSLVMTKPSKETDMNELIAAMVGRSLDNRFPPVDNTPGETILSVQNISTKYAPKLQNISFDIKKGEIFGFYGLVGAGRTELLETIFGIRTKAEGNIVYDGKVLNFSSPKDAMDHGFALITEERKANGLFLKGDITFNTTIANMSHYKSGVALSHDRMVRATAEEIKINIGAAYRRPEMITMEVRGRNLVTGLPKTIVVTSDETLEALREPAMQIVDAVHNVLERTPPELAADIFDRGIVLTGGGSLLSGLDALIEEKTGITTMIAEDPLTAVAIGTGKFIEFAHGEGSRNFD